MIKNKMTCLSLFSYTCDRKQKISLHDKMKTSRITNCKQRESQQKKIRKKNTKLGLQMTHQSLFGKNREKKHESPKKM